MTIPVMSRANLESWISSLEENHEVYPAVMDDLFSLYIQVRETRSVSILEFGSGWSTAVFALALHENAINFGEYYLAEVEHPHPFEIVTVDASEHFLQIALRRIPDYLDKIKITSLVLTPQLELYQGQIVSCYPAITGFYPDFVYLDGPDPDQVEPGNPRIVAPLRPGVPMSADVLRIENFFWPGTILVVDGRGTNARFLQNSFTRNWNYKYNEEVDQHYFHLLEEPWGSLVSKHISLRKRF